MSDAIVVLGCTLRAGAPSPALARRIELGALAYQRGVAPRVIVSGGRRWDGHVEAVVMRQALLDLEIPAEAIFMELCSLLTRENAHYSAQLMRELGAERAFLATCSWHWPRARRDFARAGVAVIDPPAWQSRAPASRATRWRETLWRLCM